MKTASFVSSLILLIMSSSSSYAHTVALDVKFFNPAGNGYGSASLGAYQNMVVQFLKSHSITSVSVSQPADFRLNVLVTDRVTENLYTEHTIHRFSVSATLVKSDTGESWESNLQKKRNNIKYHGKKWWKEHPEAKVENERARLADEESFNLNLQNLLEKGRCI